jgi:hypothetical protein
LKARFVQPQRRFIEKDPRAAERSIIAPARNQMESSEIRFGKVPTRSASAHIAAR